MFVTRADWFVWCDDVLDSEFVFLLAEVLCGGFVIGDFHQKALW